MGKHIIELLSSRGHEEAIRRMKLEPILNILKYKYEFFDFGLGGDKTNAVLINNLQSLPSSKEQIELLRFRHQKAVIILFLSDVTPFDIEICSAWSVFFDLIIVPTPEMCEFLKAYTNKKITCLFDPIDFSFTDSLARSHKHVKTPKVLWFGHPQSYIKSMAIYEDTLSRLHKNKDIEFNILTAPETFATKHNFIVSKYEPGSFPLQIQNFDMCIVNHFPGDFSTSTFFKSENKAILAINRGLPTIASRTPAYSRVFRKCGLDEYLFSSNEELVSCIHRLCDETERNRYLALSQNIILETYACTKMAASWDELFQSARMGKTAEPSMDHFTISSLPSPTRVPHKWLRPLAELCFTLGRIFQMKFLSRLGQTIWNM